MWFNALLLPSNVLNNVSPKRPEFSFCTTSYVPLLFFVVTLLLEYKPQESRDFIPLVQYCVVST